MILGIALLGGGTLGLTSGEPAPAPADSPEPPGSPNPPEIPAPLDPAIVGLGAIAAALAALQKRTGGLSPSAGLALETAADPVVVFVPGHGQPHGSVAFSDLIALMEIEDDSIRHFDYRWVDVGSNAAEASRDVFVDEAATALNAYLGGVAGDGRPIYLVGFSKGGATVAELIADWDDGRWGPSGWIEGAALLDPPIARGAHGWLQSIGRFWGSLPDDGGYDPVECGLLGLICSDRRDYLGRASGIDVIVIRNPKAAVTSFGDHPRGLRVYDAADRGPTIWGQIARNPFGLPGRIAEAHNAVLADRAVAECIVAEIRAGRCDLPPTDRPTRLPGLTQRAARAPALQKVL